MRIEKTAKEQYAVCSFASPQSSICRCLHFPKLPSIDLVSEFLFSIHVSSDYPSPADSSSGASTSFYFASISEPFTDSFTISLSESTTLSDEGFNDASTRCLSPVSLEVVSCYESNLAKQLYIVKMLTLYLSDESFRVNMSLREQLFPSPADAFKHQRLLLSPKLNLQEFMQFSFIHELCPSFFHLLDAVRVFGTFVANDPSNEAPFSFDLKDKTVTRAIAFRDRLPVRGFFCKYAELGIPFEAQEVKNKLKDVLYLPRHFEVKPINRKDIFSGYIFVFARKDQPINIRMRLVYKPNVDQQMAQNPQKEMILRTMMPLGMWFVAYRHHQHIADRHYQIVDNLLHFWVQYPHYKALCLSFEHENASQLKTRFAGQFPQSSIDRSE